jgi:hypothetical protein
VQSQAHPVLFRLTQGALEAKQQAIVVLARTVHGLLVDEDDIGQPAEVEQPMPVGRRTGQAGDLEREDRADAAVRHVLGEPLEAGAPGGAGATLAEVIRNDVDALGRPAERHRPLLEGVLAGRRFPMLVHLLKCGLAQVDRGPALAVRGADRVAGAAHRANPPRDPRVDPRVQVHPSSALRRTRC